MSGTQIRGPVETELRARIASGALFEDPAQLAAARELDALLVRLETPVKRAGLFSRKLIAPIGLYMWGGVGRGKSMLMDWFFEAADIEAKQRVHFHAFMLDVHARISRARETGQGEPIAAVAKDIAEEAALLCFDEFHVTDITDAMILSRLFEALWARGIVVVATSNRAPSGLYEHGLNRPLFEPFIDVMDDHMIIHEFAGETDHRLRQLTAAPVYYSPLGDQADAAIDAAWRRLTGEAKAKPTELSVQGRTLLLRRTAAGTARASFDRLCAQNLGAADYLRLAHAFQTVILENVPQMGPENRNEAKRFVTLIDALYETRTKLVMSAAVEPSELYKDGDGSFEFERTASRLIEMRSEDYLGARRNMGEG
ncbi:cell division protein ZapE [Litorimonas sp. RW-G-Af-16]|uniref:cell division protein ZapE n=1 Tax=Litorimonas sp. RW-G-Af-16 TaxID=3241168 RepID=UPI00390CC918